MGKPSMSRAEIRELLKLKGWTQARLATELGMSEAAVSRWLTDRKAPGPASRLMRQWLEESRKEPATV